MTRMKVLTAWSRYRAGEIGRKKRDKLCRAAISGCKQSAFNPQPLKEGEESWLKKMWNVLSPWRSKKSLAAEAARKAQAEADAKKAKV